MRVPVGTAVSLFWALNFNDRYLYYPVTLTHKTHRSRLSLSRINKEVHERHYISITFHSTFLQQRLPYTVDKVLQIAIVIVNMLAANPNPYPNPHHHLSITSTHTVNVFTAFN